MPEFRKVHASTHAVTAHTDDVGSREGFEEEWRAVIGWEKYYEVSSLGRVRGLPRRTGPRWYPGGIRKPGMVNGYLTIALQAKRDDQEKKTYGVHRLVAYAFFGEPPEGMTEVNHKNYDRGDNRVENLEWISVKANRAGRRVLGNSGYGKLRDRIAELEREILRLQPPAS